LKKNYRDIGTERQRDRRGRRAVSDITLVSYCYYRDRERDIAGGERRAVSNITLISYC
tara:strand:- start:275 stop:448 length:174 start_codon:yes stop_codon:yes gene_type:complete